MPGFVDLNFKLLVIERLMYQDRTLTPLFDIGIHLRDLGVVKDGQRVDQYVYDNGLVNTFLPQAKAYFEALPIDSGLLATIEELCVDGGHEVYQQCSPFWDGEDDLFDIASVQDVGLLPNLERLSGDARFLDPQLLAALDTRGIAYA